jgi:hypothetical protein
MRSISFDPKMWRRATPAGGLFLLKQKGVGGLPPPHHIFGFYKAILI